MSDGRPDRPACKISDVLQLTFSFASLSLRFSFNKANLCVYALHRIVLHRCLVIAPRTSIALIWHTWRTTKRFNGWTLATMTCTMLCFPFRLFFCFVIRLLHIRYACSCYLVYEISSSHCYLLVYAHDACLYEYIHLPLFMYIR